MRELQSLKIKDVKHLCLHLGTTPEELDKICADTARYYRQREIVIKGKKRPIAEPIGRLRELLDRLQKLLQRVANLDNVHGGRKGRSPRTNAMPHLRKQVVINLDIENFFPSVSHRKIYRTYADVLDCSPDAARYLTKLTTFKGALPQGAPTSTILATLVTNPMAERIRKLSGVFNVTFTQYVDDISISGSAHTVGIIDKVEDIIRQEGFAINLEKTTVKLKGDEKVVTGIRVDSQIDIPSLKLMETREELNGIIRRHLDGHAIPSKQLESMKGKIAHVASLNRGVGKQLERQFNKNFVST